jgi:hypothetical protein
MAVTFLKRLHLLCLIYFFNDTPQPLSIVFLLIKNITQIPKQWWNCQNQGPHQQSTLVTDVYIPSFLTPQVMFPVPPDNFTSSQLLQPQWVMF